MVPESAAGDCLLCGGPLPAESPGAGFCCEGCKRVSEILDASGFQGDRRASAAFLEAARAGLVPADRPPAAPGRPSQAPGAGAIAKQATLGLDGLWCPSCAWLVESVLARTPGVLDARITFFADLAEVKFDPAVVDEKTLIRRIESLGYRVRQEGDRPDRGLLIQLGIAAFLEMNVMWLTFSLYAYEGGDGMGSIGQALPWIIAAISAPVVFVQGWPMIRRAWLALKAGAVVMDTLISIGAVSAWIYSAAVAAQGSRSVYFDTASLIIMFRILGRVLEQAAFRSALRAGEAVRRLLPRKARKLAPRGASWIAADSLLVGDHIRVAPGERVPLDGRVLAGAGQVSTAVVDGEPRPREVRPGDPVPGGSVCGETALDLEVTAPAASSLLSRVADHVARASGRRSAGPDLADALARLFIPGILVLSAVTLAAWIARGAMPGLAFEHALSVLVVSCPCALGIAAPMCRVVAAGALARSGIIVRGEGALDLVASATRIAFDKTGTLTQGRPALAAMELSEASREEALAALAGLEERAGHPIAHAVREALPPGVQPLSSPDARAVAGCGVAGSLEGEAAFAGRPDWVEANAGPAPAALREQVRSEEELGRTAILLAWSRGRWAALSFGDPVRPEAASAIAALEVLGLQPTVLSGDSPQAAGAVARKVGARGSAGGCSPEDKAKFLERAESETGRRSLFVGDGINDAPGLAASVGIAVASGTDFARETADILLLEPGLAPLPTLVEAARRMRKVIRQNLVWATAYNALLIPLAATGHLTPVWAALAMVGSGLLVVLNALRIQRGGGAAPDAPRDSSGGLSLGAAARA
jgi:Cu2+-exporting ATPase